ncbi:MAG: hypothetical protein U5J83_07205 [Bryobacterales bacterium]|nr:hypothetical protein [Bryobacterales bacterium]
MQKSPKIDVPKTKRPKLPAARSAKPLTGRKCGICGAEVAPISEEDLCWVCRRLKVSAWSEGTDSQMFAPE